jgi:3-oxoacyl-[acyl-carrier-protein] synthase III
MHHFEKEAKDLAIKFRIRKNYFQDALRLMRISKSLREMEGVNKAVAVMATEKAKFALEDAGLMTEEIKGSGGSDLVMAVEADSEEIANRALARMEELISAGASGGKKESPDILHQEIQAINVGLETFKEALEAQGVKVVHVDWQVPAQGDMKLVDILKKMY